MKMYCILLMGLLAALISSCSKREALTDKIYYGEVAIGLKPLPGTPEVDLYIDGEKRGTLQPNGSTPPKFRIPVSGSATVAVYQRDTKILIADTSFQVQKDMVLDLAVANSEELGIKGWISSKPVPGDIFSFRMMNKLSNHLPGVVDVYIYLADPFTLELTETGIIVREFRRDQLHPQLLDLPIRYNADNVMMYYVGKMKEPGKDEWIMNEGIGLDMFVLIGSDGGVGKFGIYSVTDNQGYIDTMPTYL